MSRDESVEVALDQAFQQAVESAFFLEVLPGGEGESLDGGLGLEVKINLTGFISGELALQMSWETATRMAQNSPLLAGIPVDNDAIFDLWSEMINTIGGRLAAAMSKEQGAFDLSIPVASKTSLRTPDLTQHTHNYLVDHGVIRCCFIKTNGGCHANRKAV